jgi:hypothetical protein
MDSLLWGHCGHSYRLLFDLFDQLSFRPGPFGLHIIARLSTSLPSLLKALTLQPSEVHMGEEPQVRSSDSK